MVVRVISIRCALGDFDSFPDEEWRIVALQSDEDKREKRDI